jgi:hypothetical protein
MTDALKKLLEAAKIAKPTPEHRETATAELCLW